MKIRILRGTHQIGGCAAEISTPNSRILIDLGQTLDYMDEDGDGLDIPGITTGLVQCDGVFFTHYHQDHIGLAQDVLPDIPLFIGCTAKEIAKRLYTRTGNMAMQAQMARMQTYKAGQHIVSGEFTITPILTDHSAFDSYMLLIEADGKKILHTGDFRLHGFKGKGTLPALEKYVGTVDVLICEGTALSRGMADPLSERELQQQAKRLLRDNKYVFVLCASTNIDRIAAFYHTTPHGRYFLCDAFQKSILDVACQEAGRHTMLYQFDKALVYGANLEGKIRQRGFCMTVRQSPYFQSIMESFRLDDPLLVYSMWEGYLRQKENGMDDFLKNYRWTRLHTSGHAGTTALAQVCAAVKPRQGVIAVHSENPDRMQHLALPYTYISAQDGQIIEV